MANPAIEVPLQVAIRITDDSERGDEKCLKNTSAVYSRYSGYVCSPTGATRKDMLETDGLFP